MIHSEVLHIPVEFRLELMAIISANHFNPEREAFYNAVDKVDSTNLIVFGINFESPDAGCIINGCVLIPADLYYPCDP